MENLLASKATLSWHEKVMHRELHDLTFLISFFILCKLKIPQYYCDRQPALKIKEVTAVG